MVKNFLIGSEWRTRDGHRAIVIANHVSQYRALECVSSYPIHAVIIIPEGENIAETYTERGTAVVYDESPRDLVCPWHDWLTIEKWAVVSIGTGRVNSFYETEEEAQLQRQLLGSHHYAVIKFTGVQ